MSFEFLLLLTCTLLLCVHHSAGKPKWTLAIEEKCEFTTSNNWIIKFEEHPALFIININKENAHECRTECCSHQTCNGYVFHSADKTESCRLLKCSRNGVDCKSALVDQPIINNNGDVPADVPAVPAEVGFITGLGGPPVKNVTNAVPILQNHIENNAAIPKQNEVASPKETHVKEEAIKPTVSHLDNRTTAAKPDPEVHLLYSSNHDDDVPKKSHLVPDMELMENYTQLQLTNYMDPFHNDIKEHTNNISLTIALVFGMAFLVTVFYLTGKRWVEGIKDRQRKGYTRINYLLNGV